MPVGPTKRDLLVSFNDVIFLGKRGDTDQENWLRVHWLPLVLAASLGAVVISIVLSYSLRWTWTGFGDKRFWHWLQLLVVPAVLGIGARWLTDQARIREEYL